MSEAKHTPGPWNEGRADMQTIVDGVGSKWIYAGKKYVAIASGRASKDWGEVMANARLIAASPELLAELKKLIYLIDEGNIGPTSAAKTASMRAAVAKAEGEISKTTAI